MKGKNMASDKKIWIRWEEKKHEFAKQIGEVSLNTGVEEMMLVKGYDILYVALMHTALANYVKNRFVSILPCDVDKALICETFIGKRGAKTIISLGIAKEKMQYVKEETADYWENMFKKRKVKFEKVR